jgi:hypothetical protein
MAMPKFSIRELLMLMVIVALLLPYAYHNAFRHKRVDLSLESIDAVIEAADSGARGIEGSATKHDTDEVERSCLVPKSTSRKFPERIVVVLEEHLRKGGWNGRNLGGSYSNDRIMNVTYELHRGPSRCLVRLYFLDQREVYDPLYKTDVDEIRFVVIALYGP